MTVATGAIGSVALVLRETTVLPGNPIVAWDDPNGVHVRLWNGGGWAPLGSSDLVGDGSKPSLALGSVPGGGRPMVCVSWLAPPSVAQVHLACRYLP